MKNGKKPPLGIEPEYIWKSKRLEALNGAISRYFNEGLPVSEEWVRERNSLLAQGFSLIYEEEVSPQQVQEPINEVSQLPESTQDLTKPAWYGVFDTGQGDVLSPVDTPVHATWNLKYRVFAKPAPGKYPNYSQEVGGNLKEGDVVCTSEGCSVEIIKVELLN